jgi:hypothetical protein
LVGFGTTNFTRGWEPTLSWNQFLSFAFRTSERADGVRLGGQAYACCEMAENRVPRWMNMLWLVFVFCLTSSYIIVAVHRGYNLVQTIGFLVAGIFWYGLLSGLALYGLSLLLRRKTHGSKGADDDHSGDMANLVP